MCVCVCVCVCSDRPGTIEWMYHSTFNPESLKSHSKTYDQPSSTVLGTSMINLKVPIYHLLVSVTYSVLQKFAPKKITPSVEEHVFYDTIGCRTCALYCRKRSL